ncbi:MAG: DUF72 domain-containing protein [Phormidium tanganyikae FI6-MK23]|jgi:uncharacterized protein YecE (DUF72 family)|nr:DUF72 domain-containing protein [Phormidium tanganyikae FI6-MK23]
MLQIGTSGWVYKHWMKRFYPARLLGEQQLAFYAQHFSTVEVNFSFYRLPPRSTFATWYDQTPDNFLFAVKASRYLTHLKKLKDPQEPLARLIEAACGLQEKLAVILFQFPPNWHLDLDRLEAFLEVLQSYPNCRYVMEFRHPSWLTAPMYQQLERSNVALCLPISPTVPIDVRLTTAWTYLRFHQGRYGIAYDQSELMDWAKQIQSFLDQKIDVYAYFNNDAEGYAIQNANELKQLMKLDLDRLIVG